MNLLLMYYLKLHNPLNFSYKLLRRLACPTSSCLLIEILYFTHMDYFIYRSVDILGGVLVESSGHHTWYVIMKASNTFILLSRVALLVLSNFNLGFILANTCLWFGQCLAINALHMKCNYASTYVYKLQTSRFV